MALRVEKRTALIFHVFIFERFTFDIPTRSANSLSDIFRSAITLSKRKIIAIFLSPIMFHRIAAVKQYHIQIYSLNIAQFRQLMIIPVCKSIANERRKVQK